MPQAQTITDPASPVVVIMRSESDVERATLAEDASEEVRILALRGRVSADLRERVQEATFTSRRGPKSGFKTMHCVPIGNDSALEDRGGTRRRNLQLELI